MWAPRPVSRERGPAYPLPPSSDPGFRLLPSAADTGQSLAFLPIMMVAGLVYQYWLVTAFLIATIVPIIGAPIGDAMTRYAIHCMGERHHAAPENQAQISASMNYPYFWFHLYFWLEAVGLSRSFDGRNDCAALHVGRDPIPILFFFGADKGFKFHGEGWEAKLKSLEEENGSRVVAMPSAAIVAAWEHGTWPEKPKNIGHWLMLRDAKAVNGEMEAWLKQTDGDDVD